MTAEARPLSILVCALGGEGGGVLCEWLVDAARHAGYPVQGTSIPGVAQRTGATTYYLEIFPQPTAQLGGQRPVLSLYPVPGALDLGRDPVWFGSPNLPEQVNASTVRDERRRAAAASRRLLLPVQQRNARRHARCTTQP